MCNFHNSYFVNFVNFVYFVYLDSSCPMWEQSGVWVYTSFLSVRNPFRFDHKLRAAPPPTHEHMLDPLSADGADSHFGRLADRRFGLWM